MQAKACGRMRKQGEAPTLHQHTRRFGSFRTSSLVIPTVQNGGSLGASKYLALLPKVHAPENSCLFDRLKISLYSEIVYIWLREDCVIFRVIRTPRQPYGSANRTRFPWTKKTSTTPKALTCFTIAEVSWTKNTERIDCLESTGDLCFLCFFSIEKCKWDRLSGSKRRMSFEKEGEHNLSKWKQSSLQSQWRKRFSPPFGMVQPLAQVWVGTPPNLLGGSSFFWCFFLVGCVFKGNHKKHFARH